MMTEFGQLMAGLRQFYRVPGDVAEHISQTRDVFQARLDSFYRLGINRQFSEQDMSLISALAGEVGNNVFDHNVGQWLNTVGAYFHYRFSDEGVVLVIADNGRGVLQSLARVVPGLIDGHEALTIAFEQKVSGRAPENRGNGLKFVRSIVNGSSNKFLFCVSGGGRIELGGDKRFLSLSHSMTPPIQGVSTVMTWRFM